MTFFDNKNETIPKKKNQRRTFAFSYMTEQDVDEIVTISNKEQAQVCF